MPSPVPPVPDPDPDSWELSPASAHPAAAAAFDQPWYWDCTDDYTPFGNDTGADTLEFFREWLAASPKDASPLLFLKALLRGQRVRDRDWHEMDCDRLLKLIRKDAYSFGSRDRIVTALAFGQILFQGRLHPDIRPLALAAVRRQLLPCLLELWGPDAPIRKERFTHMLSVLERPWPQ